MNDIIKNSHQALLVISAAEMPVEFIEKFFYSDPFKGKNMNENAYAFYTDGDDVYVILCKKNGDNYLFCDEELNVYQILKLKHIISKEDLKKYFGNFFMEKYKNHIIDIFINHLFEKRKRR